MPMRRSGFTNSTRRKPTKRKSGLTTSTKKSRRSIKNPSVSKTRKNRSFKTGFTHSIKRRRK